MPADDLEAKANHMAKEAKGNIKSSRLVRTTSGPIETMRFGAYLSSDPIISYFKKNEQPHYFHYNESKGVKIGNIKEKSGYTGDYRNGMWVTNKGIHFTVGMKPNDFHQFISYKNIYNIEASSGVLKNKFEFETDKGEVRFPTDPARDIDDTQSYIGRKIRKTPTESSSKSTVNQDSVDTDNKNNTDGVSQSANKKSNQQGDLDTEDSVVTDSTTDEDTPTIKLLSNADEYVTTADDFRSQGNIEEAVNKFSKAIEIYEEAMEGANEEKTVDRISKSLEETREKYKKTNKLYESISSLREQLQSAERNFKEAVAAYISGSDTVANIRFRQARDQYEEALTQVEETDADLFENPVSVFVEIAIEEPQKDITGYSHISDDTISVLTKNSIGSLAKIEEDARSESPNCPEYTIISNFDSGKESKLKAEIVSWWYGDEDVTFKSTKEISTRHQQAKCGFEIT